MYSMQCEIQLIHPGILSPWKARFDGWSRDILSAERGTMIV